MIETEVKIFLKLDYQMILFYYFFYPKFKQ